MLLALAAALAAFALWLHLPGEASFDTSIQLLEAQTGVSRSWNPPFMSALLQAFGGGTRAMALFVLSSTLLTYGGMALALGRWRPQAWPATLGSVLILANPTILLYVGIVWKDVLFAALLCLACGASLSAARAAPGRWRVAAATLAGLALVVAAHVRQQGMLLLPLLALCPLLAMAPLPRPRLAWIAGWVLLLGVAFIAVASWTGSRIEHLAGHDRERGVRRMIMFDVVGTAAQAGTTIPGMDASVEQIRSAYTPERIDTLSRERALGLQFRSMSNAQLRGLWFDMARTHPDALLQHRAAVASRVLNFAHVEGCLPLHVGVEGDRAALDAVGIASGSDARDLWKYRASRPLLWTPWFRHFGTLAALCAIVVIAWRRRRQKPAVVALWFAGAMVLYTLVTAALAIACDFRYLYPAITVASACALGLLGTAAAPRRPRNALSVPGRSSSSLDR